MASGDTLWEVVSLTSVGVCGSAGGVKSPALFPAVGIGLRPQMSWSSAVIVISESSRLCDRTRLTGRLISLSGPGDDESNGRVGEGGRGLIGEWKEWKESMLDERLVVSSDTLGELALASGAFDGGTVFKLN